MVASVAAPQCACAAPPHAPSARADLLPTFRDLDGRTHRGQNVLFAPEAAAPWTEFERGRWERPNKRSEKRQVTRDTASSVPRLRSHQVPGVPGLHRDPAAQRTPHVDALAAPRAFRAILPRRRAGMPRPHGGAARSVRGGGMPYAFADSHWSPEGHQLVALRLEELSSFGWLAGLAAVVPEPGRGKDRVPPWEPRGRPRSRRPEPAPASVT